MLQIGQHHFFRRAMPSMRNTVRKAAPPAEKQEKLRHHCRRFISGAGATLVTGSLFLGGSYLFFVKLAEFGW